MAVFAFNSEEKFTEIITDISASLMSASGSNSCYIKLYTHEYPN